MFLALPIGLVSAAAAAQVGSPAAVQSPAGLFYTGDAYGTYAFVGKTVVAGKSAVVGLGCTTTAGVHNTNTVASVNVPNVVTTGAINTTADSIATGSSVESTTSADVHDASLLSGLITASEVKAVSTTSHDATGFHVSAAGSSFVNLVVNGVPITVTPAPNTTITLPGVGMVVLNEQITHIGATTASFTVNMIHVFVTVDLPGIAKGTQIIVAHATSDLELNKAGSLDGIAYGTKAHVGNLVLSGPSAVVNMPCGGTNGRVHTNSVASVNVPNIISTGTVTDTAQGTIDATTASGETTLHRANSGSALQPGYGGCGQGRRACRQDRRGHHPQRRRIDLREPGGQRPADLPRMLLRTPRSPLATSRSGCTRVIQTPNSIEIRMIEIIVNGPNPFNLQTGTDIRVAVAEASVH